MAQHCKCCYCERQTPAPFSDVEHYRPKASANRLPGSELRHGYWWLAFTWENLLFACPNCNRSAKNSLFPLDHGSTPLHAEEVPLGGEIPLLLDPGSTINPVEHIEFVFTATDPDGKDMGWWAQPRNGSRLGDTTISVCGLNLHGQRELRRRYYLFPIANFVKALDDALAKEQSELAVEREYHRALGLLDPTVPYVGFSYDALRFHIPDSRLQAAIKKSWPAPSEVGIWCDVE